MLTGLHQAGVLRESGPTTAAALRGPGLGDLHQAHTKGQPHAGAGAIFRGVSSRKTLASNTIRAVFLHDYY